MLRLLIGGLALAASLPALAQPTVAQAPGIYSWVISVNHDGNECMRRARRIAERLDHQVIADHASLLILVRGVSLSYNIRCDQPGRVILITAGTVNNLQAESANLRRLYLGG